MIAEHLGEPWQIAILLAVFAIVLWLADRRPQEREPEDLSLWAGVGIGCAQALALMPGVSRSGVTISAARFLRLGRDEAARLSFLMLAPITLGAVVFKGVDDVLLGDLPAGWEGPFVVGTLAAAGSGLLAIWALLGYVRRHDYTIFVLYRLFLAAARAAPDRERSRERELLGNRLAEEVGVGEVRLVDEAVAGARDGRGIGRDETTVGADGRLGDQHPRLAGTLAVDADDAARRAFDAAREPGLGEDPDVRHLG